MKKIFVIAVSCVAMASLAGCAGVGKGIGKGVGKGKGPVVVDQPAPVVVPQQTYVTKG